MTENGQDIDGATLKRLVDEIGLNEFMDQINGLQGSLGRVAEGMQSLGDSAVKQVRDTENLAAHILAIETVLTVILRQIPVDINEVREEATRRTRSIDAVPGEGPSVVVQLAEDIVSRADD